MPRLMPKARGRKVMSGGKDQWGKRARVTASTGLTARRLLKMSAGRRDRLISVLSPFLLLGIWELSARLGMIDTRFFPAPITILHTLIGLMDSGVLWIHTWASLQRLFWGFILGGIPALVLGIIMGLSRPVRAAIDPIIAATYPIPKSAILPLILLIFGLGEASKIVMVAIGMFYPICINAVAGVLEINKIYLDVGKNFPGQPLADVPHHRTTGCAAVHHVGDQTRGRHGTNSHRHSRDDWSEERTRLHDLECLGNPLGRYHVCGPNHDRRDWLSVQSVPERVRTLDHSLEGGAVGHPRQRSSNRYQPGVALWPYRLFIASI
jgi:hypothetical protein